MPRVEARFRNRASFVFLDTPVFFVAATTTLAGQSESLQARSVKYISSTQSNYSQGKAYSGIVSDAVHESDLKPQKASTEA